MTIFGPFGGEAGRGPQMQAGQEANVAAFRGGNGDCEVVSVMREGDLAVIVMVERNTVMFEGRTEPHPWALRTTQVFRRDRPGHWLRLHRHADPLIRRRPLQDTLSLLAYVDAVA
jgi:ketosteroid isomerase-like protein